MWFQVYWVTSSSLSWSYLSSYALFIVNLLHWSWVLASVLLHYPFRSIVCLGTRGMSFLIKAGNHEAWKLVCLLWWWIEGGARWLTIFPYATQSKHPCRCNFLFWFVAPPHYCDDGCPKNCEEKKLKWKWGTNPHFMIKNKTQRFSPGFYNYISFLMA